MYLAEAMICIIFYNEYEYAEYGMRKKMQNMFKNMSINMYNL